MGLWDSFGHDREFDLQREVEGLTQKLELERGMSDGLIEENDRMLTAISEQKAEMARLADEVETLEKMLLDLVDMHSVGDIVQWTGLPSVRAKAIRDRALRDI